MDMTKTDDFIEPTFLTPTYKLFLIKADNYEGLSTKVSLANGAQFWVGLKENAGGFYEVTGDIIRNVTKIKENRVANFKIQYNNEHSDSFGKIFIPNEIRHV